MARAFALSTETPDAHDGFVPCADTDLYPGDRVRIRDMPKLKTPAGTSMMMPVRVNGHFQKAAARRFRTIVGDVRRVSVGVNGLCYVTGAMVSCDTSDGHKPGVSSFLHRMGSKISQDSSQKQLFRSTEHGPSEAERAAETPLEMSSRLWMAEWQRYLGLIDAAGVPKGIWRQALHSRGEAYVEHEHTKMNLRRSANGQEPRPISEGLGDAEARFVDDVLDRGAEPRSWMMAFAKAAVADPSEYLV